MGDGVPAPGKVRTEAPFNPAALAVSARMNLLCSKGALLKWMDPGGASMRVRVDRHLLEHETRIVWVRPEWQEAPFLREEAVSIPSRTGRIPDKRGHRVAAYAEVCPQGPLVRRVWYLRDGDEAAFSGETCPMFGVLPGSIAAGMESLPALASILQRVAERRPLSEREERELAETLSDIAEIERERAEGEERTAPGQLKPLVDTEGRLVDWLIQVHCPWCHEDLVLSGGLDLSRESWCGLKHCREGSGMAYRVEVRPESIALAGQRTAANDFKRWPWGGAAVVQGVILLVEKDPEVAAAVIDRLTERGHWVAAVRTAEAAFQWLARHSPPLLVLLDGAVLGPEMDRFLGKLRANPALRSTPVVVTSGWGGRITDVAAYLPRPLDLDELEAVCESLCSEGAPLPA